MANIARKSDGRRIFTNEFKAEQIGRVLRGELTVAELGRKLGIARSLLQRWKRLTPQGVALPEAARARMIPTSERREAHYVRELQVLVGKQTAELEFCRAELDALKKRRPAHNAKR